MKMLSGRATVEEHISLLGKLNCCKGLFLEPGLREGGRGGLQCERGRGGVQCERERWGLVIGGGCWLGLVIGGGCWLGLVIACECWLGLVIACECWLAVKVTGWHRLLRLVLTVTVGAESYWFVRQVTG